jgi:hypothetical protein
MQNWNSKVQFPTDNFIVRCTEASFGPSKSSQKPMITLEFEVVSPDAVNVAGEDYNVAGQKTRPMYFVTQSIDAEGNLDISKTENIKKRLDDLCEKFGVPPITNPENPDVAVFKGKEVWALLASDIQQKCKSPTADQLSRGLKQGDVIKDPITGKPVVSYWPKIDSFYGLVQA